MPHLARVTLLLVSLALASTVSCKSASTRPTEKRGEGAPLPEGGVFHRADLLRSIAQCTTTRTRELERLAVELEAAAAKHAADPSEPNRAAAQAAWVRAMVLWQKLEVFQFGPAAKPTALGGQDLRDSIYSWPLGGRCLVEQILVSKGYEAATFKDGAINTRGLLAAEYLLFYAGSDNACAPTAAINTTGSWAAIAPTELAARRAAYSKAAASDVVLRARALADAWDPAKGNFEAQLATAGAGSTTYKTDQLALNAVSDAMFYLEFEVKDMKVGRPAGILDCATPSCPELLESAFAKKSKEHVRNNVLGFRMLYKGCGPDFTGLAFDDYLHAVGSGALADEIDAAIVDVLRAIDAIEEADFDEALARDLPSVRAVHAALKRVTDRLKTDVLTLWDLEIPTRVAGDND